MRTGKLRLLRNGMKLQLMIIKILVTIKTLTILMVLERTKTTQRVLVRLLSRVRRQAYQRAVCAPKLSEQFRSKVDLSGMVQLSPIR